MSTVLKLSSREPRSSRDHLQRSALRLELRASSVELRAWGFELYRKHPHLNFSYSRPRRKPRAHQQHKHRIHERTSMSRLQWNISDSLLLLRKP
eukprot:scaffold286_cov247-Pinguiococcus_pyrenoidosus.AAC.19